MSRFSLSVLSKANLDAILMRLDRCLRYLGLDGSLNDAALSANIPRIDKTRLTAFTPVLTASGVGATLVTANPNTFYALAGDEMEILFFLQSATVSVISAYLGILVPAGYRIAILTGTAAPFNEAGVTGIGAAIANPSTDATTLRIFHDVGGVTTWGAAGAGQTAVAGRIRFRVTR